MNIWQRRRWTSWLGLFAQPRDRLGVVIDGEAEIDVLGDLFDIKLRPTLLSDAARALCADRPHVKRSPRW